MEGGFVNLVTFFFGRLYSIIRLGLPFFLISQGGNGHRYPSGGLDCNNKHDTFLPPHPFARFIMLTVLLQFGWR